MKIVIFGLSISCSWGNGHATLWRALCAELIRAGHDIVFFERDLPFYRPYRDLTRLPDWAIALPAARRELAGADAAIVSKELLPVGSRTTEGPPDRPRAVSEYIVERMVLAGATTICFVIARDKHDIVRHHGAGAGPVPFVYAMQSEPRGLCDAIFTALPVVRADEPVLVGLPDTVWFPETGLALLPRDQLAFLLFPVDQPSLFDAVLTDEFGCVKQIQVKSGTAQTHWVWGAFAMPGAIFHDLHRLWLRREARDQYVGTLVNAFLAQGGRAVGLQAGRDYVDVGTFNGYRNAIQLLRERSPLADGLKPASRPIPGEDPAPRQATTNERNGMGK